MLSYLNPTTGTIAQRLATSVMALAILETDANEKVNAVADKIVTKTQRMVGASQSAQDSILSGLAIGLVSGAITIMTASLVAKVVLPSRA